MSAVSHPLLDDACCAYVRWLTQRTQQGRAHWQTAPNGLFTHLPGSMFVQFLTEPDGAGGQKWRLLTVRDASSELLRATPPSTIAGQTALAEAADVLFIAVTHPTGLCSSIH
jgi:hypothetical protein